MSSARHRAREFALQGLYQWQVSGNDAAAIEAHMGEVKGFDKADRELFIALLYGAIGNKPQLEGLLTPLLDRRFEELSPVERAILMIGAFELAYRRETPYRVVINEAIELAKAYGATDGFKYVNGVLDQLAQEVQKDPTSIPKKATPGPAPDTNARNPLPRSITDRATGDRDDQTASSSFTHYWTLDTCKFNADGEDHPLEHTADNAFVEAGVKPGDRIYVVTNPQGSLHLVGRLVVGSIVSFEEAKRLLGDGVWDARDQILARPGSGAPKRFNRKVPPEIVRSLLFFRADGIRGLVLSPDGKVDRQTLRNVSRLTADSAQLLEGLLS